MLHPGVPVMWYGHIRDLFTTAEGCKGSRLPNVTMLHWAQQKQCYGVMSVNCGVCVGMLVRGDKKEQTESTLRQTTLQYINKCVENIDTDKRQSDNNIYKRQREKERERERVMERETEMKRDKNEKRDERGEIERE